MADDLGRKPITGLAEASERRHPTRLPILVCQRKPGPQVDGAHQREAMSTGVVNDTIPGSPVISENTPLCYQREAASSEIE